MIHLATCCTTEQRKTSFVISKFLIKIDSSDLLDMTITYNENLMTSLWDSGIVTVARYCNWFETFNIIFSETNISSSFSFKMTDGLLIVWEWWFLMGVLWTSLRYNCWFAFCDIICIFRQQWSEFVVVLKVNILWTSLSFAAAFSRMSDLPIRIIYVEFLFCLVLPLMVLFVIFFSLLRDKCSTILSLEF